MKFEQNMKKIFFLSLIALCACQSKKKMPESYQFRMLSDTIAAKLIEMPMACVNKEYPNKLNQSLDSANEIGTPAELHPAFYGCYDWHSSVHGHWMMLALRNRFPKLAQNQKVMELIMHNITQEKMAVELAYFQRSSEKSFERTYGWAWYLKLTQEAKEMNSPEGDILYQNLCPLAIHIANNYKTFLPKLLYPIRTGEHPNTAFGLSFAYDYAIATGDHALEKAIVKTAKEMFLADKNCPLTWEPSGYDFLSPCLEEANLMSRILPQAEYLTWLAQFLPQLSNPAFEISLGEVIDRTDGKLAHLDGLNFSRAWCLYRIAKIDKKYAHLKALGDKHIAYSLSRMKDGNYSGDHWLGSFATLALLEAK